MKSIHERAVTNPYAQCPVCGQVQRLTDIRNVRQIARHHVYTGKGTGARPVCKGSNKPEWVGAIEWRTETYGSM